MAPDRPEPSAPTLPAEVLETVVRLLRDTAGGPVEVRGCRVLTDELSVARVTIESGGRLPGSVIVRVPRTVGGWRTDPSYLATEYAATRLLGDVTATTPVSASGSGSSALCPRVLAGDPRLGVVVTEDLGSGPTLDDLLAGDDPGRAIEAMVGLADALGGLHAATVGLSEAYDSIRADLGPAEPRAYRTRLVDRSLRTSWSTLARTVGELGLDTPPSVRAEVDAILAALDEPGPFAALSNGDLCPYNCLVAPEGIRFVDFELAGFRHALLDASCLRFPFQTCYRWGRLPPEPRSVVERTYRVRLGQHNPAVLDDGAYEPMMANACGAWTIECLRRPATAAGLGGARRQAARQLAVVRTFVEASERSGTLTALAEWFDRLAARIARDHTGIEVDAPPPLYPAFRTPNGGPVEAAS